MRKGVLVGSEYEAVGLKGAELRDGDQVMNLVGPCCAYACDTERETTWLPSSTPAADVNRKRGQMGSDWFRLPGTALAILSRVQAWLSAGEAWPHSQLYALPGWAGVSLRAGFLHPPHETVMGSCTVAMRWEQARRVTACGPTRGGPKRSILQR
ncbi:hypothetical protein SKAU_G00317090 [Synaphobranchus kaupii]|uniref:Uncharacterized protein n=1 Tax=Synaphobranchus kaupii TaxID=118154 RepID=A0A9Q1ILY4_SYNKA|nr:hypothetical protein SKAU_G00317090 [Synaphobranchus kaupii]